MLEVGKTYKLEHVDGNKATHWLDGVTVKAIGKNIHGAMNTKIMKLEKAHDYSSYQVGKEISFSLADSRLKEISARKLKFSDILK